MTSPEFHDLGDGVYCIDALYIRPELACCYLLGSNDEYALIETGTAHSLENILATLQALNVRREQLRYIIPTHVHLDHAGGAGQLMQHFPDATLAIHPRGAKHMINPQKLVASSEQVYGKETFARLYGEILPVPETRVLTLEDGAVIELGSRRLRVMHTRGHAEHHFCLYDESSSGWFSGDMYGVSYPTLRFAEGAFVMPATTPTQFHPGLYKQSVRALADSRPQKLFLTHFSALPFDPAQAEALCRQLDAYAALAEDPGSEIDRDLGATVEAIRRITEEELGRLVGAERARTSVKTLEADARLNAQGVAYLRQRKSRVSAQS